MEKVRIGEFKDIANEDLLNNVDFEDKNSLVNLLPFEGVWHKSGEGNVSQLLVDSLIEMSNKKSIDESTMFSHTALCAAAFVNELSPTDEISINDINVLDTKQVASEWLASKLEKSHEATNYLTNYLSMCAFSNIIKWCKEKVVGKYFLSSLEELILTKRVHAMNIVPILLGDYRFIRDSSKKLNPEDIFSWMQGWREHTEASKNWLKWDADLVSDILEYEPEFLLEQLISCLDNDKVTKEIWLNYIEEHHSTIEKIVLYFIDKNDFLTNQDSLLSALKEIPVQQSDYDFTLVDSLTKLVDKRKINGMNTSLKASLLKSDTSLERRYRTIKYFGSRINMPNINTVNLQMEVINLIDNAISQENETVKRWLLDQSTWNISKWSEENLNGLSVILESASDLKEEKLTTDVRMRLEELSVNEEPLVDGISGEGGDVK
ncbi:hypothetical protein A8139_04660 [Marinomonas primoryensis]|uniref:Uncharacterized protein n=1 Tax=Marinomonas primoryensis TaxID=178399 RepID=A0A2Z4PPI1_9GAMM|nr:hypothetical protein [Marinomonas primoryensis]AWX99372.1 hypothetical protein A8139_04660 [Marinomonas primoryensis]